MSEDILFRQKQYTYIENIVSVSLNSISYKSVTRKMLVDEISRGIFEKNENWIKNFKKFAVENKDCIKSLNKYYAKDNYEGLYNEKYLKEFKPYLDAFISLVREAKSNAIKDIKYQGVKSYFKNKKKELE